MQNQIQQSDVSTSVSETERDENKGDCDLDEEFEYLKCVVNGEEVSRIVVDDGQDVESVVLVLPCPCCGSDNRVTFGFPLTGGDGFSCDECGEEVTFVPDAETDEIRDLDLIEGQIRLVRDQRNAYITGRVSNRKESTLVTTGHLVKQLALPYACLLQAMILFAPLLLIQSFPLVLYPIFLWLALPVSYGFGVLIQKCGSFLMKKGLRSIESVKTVDDNTLSIDTVWKYYEQGLSNNV